VRLTAFLVLISSLVFAGYASAKDIQNAVVCGASGCQETEHGSQLQWLAEVGDSSGPPGAAAFYTVRVLVNEDNGQRETLRGLYVPSRNRVGAMPDGSQVVKWFEALPQYVKAVAAIAPDVKPYPPSRFPTSPTSLLARPAPADHGWSFFLAVGLAGAVALAGTGALLVRGGRWRRRTAAEAVVSP
jgi:hypothetical protein